MYTLSTFSLYKDTLSKPDYTQKTPFCTCSQTEVWGQNFYSPLIISLSQSDSLESSIFSFNALLNLSLSNFMPPYPPGELSESNSNSLARLLNSIMLGLFLSLGGYLNVIVSKGTPHPIFMSSLGYCKRN